jgi:uncharacterized protein YjiS (DUF1127 family)
MTTIAHTFGRAHSPFAGLIALFRAWRTEARKRAAYRETRDRLSELSDRELDDLGLTRWDIDRAARKSVYGV